jgi:hypothetical protein
LIIPGRAEGANPESIIVGRERGRGSWLWIPALAALGRMTRAFSLPMTSPELMFWYELAQQA